MSITTNEHETDSYSEYFLFFFFFWGLSWKCPLQTVHYFQFHNSKQQIRPLRCLEERSLLYEWAVQYSKHRREREKQNVTGPNKPRFRVCSQGHPPRVRVFDRGCSLEKSLEGNPKRLFRQFSKQTNNKIGLFAQIHQNATQIIIIIMKRNKVCLYIDWRKHCNMLEMWFLFSFCFPAQWVFFLSMYFFFFSCFCCLEVSPIATCYHLLFTDTHGFEVRAKALLSSENVPDNTKGPILDLTLFCDLVPT